MNKGGRLRVNPSVEGWLAALDAHADFPEMEHINESGLRLSDYLAQWRGRLLPGAGVRNLLLGVKPEAVSKPDEEYKDTGMLTDGVRGLLLGYHYGWHISSEDLEVAFPAGNAAMRGVSKCRSSNCRATACGAPACGRDLQGRRVVPDFCPGAPMPKAAYLRPRGRGPHGCEAHFGPGRASRRQAGAAGRR